MTNYASLSEQLKNLSRFLALAVVVIVPLLLLGCPGNTNKPADNSATTPASPAKSDFDGDRAFEQVRKQVEFGPRPAGSTELEQTRNYMIKGAVAVKVRLSR